MLTLSTSLRTLGVLLLFSAISACSDVVIQKVGETPFCSNINTLNDRCQYEVGESTFWIISSNPKMPVEELVQLRLYTEVEFSPLQSEIRGVSMYMGRIPVVWQQEDSHTWRADIMLGACTDPDMIWELIIKKGSHSKRLPFQSMQP